MSEEKQEVQKAKYLVTSKFAVFEKGQTIELTVPCPSAAQPHVQLYTEPQNEEGAKQADTEALDALKRVYESVSGDKAGKKQVKTLESAIATAFEEAKQNLDNKSGELDSANDKVSELESQVNELLSDNPEKKEG